MQKGGRDKSKPMRHDRTELAAKAGAEPGHPTGLTTIFIGVSSVSKQNLEYEKERCEGDTPVKKQKKITRKNQFLSKPPDVGI